MRQTNGIDTRDAGLIAPRSSGAVESVGDILRDEARDIRASALRDAVVYLKDNSLNSAKHDVKHALNIRHNLAFKICDAIIEEARPLADREIARIKAERIRAEEDRIAFEQLAGLFCEPVHVHKDGELYTLTGLTESQIRLCADVLVEGAE